MKKILPFKLCLSLALMLTFIACSSGNDDDPTPPQVETPKIEIPSSQTPPVIEQQGGSATVAFTATDNWTADVAAATRTIDWCSVSPTSGTAGSHSLTITTTANDTYDERRATVTLRSGKTTKSFTVTQKQKDALTVTSDKIEMEAIGGEATIEIKANVSCQYNIEESARTWISVVNTRGLSTSILKLNIAENDNTKKREGTITIQSGDLSEKVNVYQEGSKPTLVLTQNEYTVGCESEMITVELKSNIDYEVQLPAENWIIESETRAFSSHTHHFIIATNEGYDARTAEITFINKENNLAEKVKVTQMQRDALIIAQNEYTVPAVGGNLDFTVSTNVDFNVESSVDWIKQVSTRGLTEKVLRFTVEENNTEASREAAITLKTEKQKQVIRINQELGVSATGGNIDDIIGVEW